jgi:hypothetical protein
LIDGWGNGETVKVSGDDVGERKLLGIRTYERSRMVVWQWSGDWLGRIGSIQDSFLIFSWDIREESLEIIGFNDDRLEWRRRFDWGEWISCEGLVVDFWILEDNFQNPPLPFPDSFFVRGTLIKDLFKDKLCRIEF